MPYELAKELVDAGYQLRRIEPGMCIGPWPVLDMNPSGDREIGAQHFYAPTLSELIETCGEDFSALRQYESGAWFASVNKKDEHGNWIEVAGWSSPTEAVARLWLALRMVE